MRINKEKCLALFVDYQEKLIPAQFEGEAFISNSATLAKGLIALDIPIIVSEQYSKGLGSTVDALSSIEGFPVAIEKDSFSCMLNENLKSAVKNSGAKHIIVSGCETHICVLQTVMDLIDMGLTVFLANECCTSRTLRNHKMGIKRAMQEGAFITSVESVLFEMLKFSGGDTFKYISNLIK